RVVADLAAGGIERSLDAVDLGPRSEILPAQAHLHRQLVGRLPVVVDKRRECRRSVSGPRTAERARACRAVAEEEIGDRVAGELAVEREAAAWRHFSEMFEVAILRLDAEAEVVVSLHPAGRVRDAHDVLGRALCDATFAVAGES